MFKVFPDPHPSLATRPQQIMKCRHSDYRHALSVHREKEERGTRCALNTQNVMHLLNQMERNWSLRFLAEIKGWTQAPNYMTICEGQILIVLCFVICLFQWYLLTKWQVFSVWKPKLSHVLQTLHQNGRSLQQGSIETGQTHSIYILKYNS